MTDDPSDRSGAGRHDPGARVDRQLAAQFRHEPVHEALARLYDVSQDLYMTVAPAVRQQHAEYMRRRIAARGAGIDTDSPNDGGATLNAAIRRGRGRAPAQPEPVPQPAADPRESVIAAAQAARFANPELAWRALRDDLADDGSNAAALVADLARSEPYMVAPMSPAGDVGQGYRGTPAAGAQNDAVNAWLRSGRDNRRDQRGQDADAFDSRTRP
jgi:hypothetical protein